ncbi:MAG: amidohydrolase family protein [Myxococcota bacterium]
MPLEALVSSDSHIVEPPDLWTSRMRGDFAERAPRVVSEESGDWWYIDGKRSMSFLGVQTGDRFEKDARELIIEARWEDVRAGAHDPRAFIEENAGDGVVASVIYPSEALLAYAIPDTELCSATMATYNDFIAEFCSEDPARLKGIALVNIDDPAAAVQEMQRCRDAGLAGAMITVLPPAEEAYDQPRYESVWAASVDLDMPISMHVATGRQFASVDVEQPSVREVSEAAFYLQDHFIRKSLGEMIFSGVFERHPKLRVGSVEHEVCWIPFFLSQMDYTYTERPLRGDWHRFAPGVLPSDFFRSNCFVSFQEDAVGIRTRDIFGVHTLMWGSDYPHTESTFPRSREIVGKILADVPEDEQALIVRDNAAKLYGFDVEALTA